VKLLLSCGVPFAILATIVTISAPAADAASGRASAGKVRVVKVHYRAHNGLRRAAYVVLPAWYRGGNRPELPLIISPHGRGLDGRANARLWGNLPARGRFIVVNPDGAGRSRKLTGMSWGFRGQIDDLARMPGIVTATLPWVRIDRSRVYAFGGSMGGQESLLLLARYPDLLAGVAVFDSVTDLARQYERFPQSGCNARCRKLQGAQRGAKLRKLARREIGGTPKTARFAFRARSPMTYVKQIASTCVPLQMWWSVADKIVVDPQQQSGRLFWEIRRLNPRAHIQGFVGYWIHTSVMRAKSKLPRALATFGLLPEAALIYDPVPMHWVREQPLAWRCGEGAPVTVPQRPPEIPDPE
jgi:pimeloyl-ACP methyl ester carboxylesterase